MENCRQWNKDDALIGLLCLEDALDNLNQNVGSSLLHESADPRTSDIEKTALLNALSYRIHLIEEAATLILNLGKDEARRLDRFPKIEFAINVDKESVLGTLRLAPQDSFWVVTLRMLGQIEI